MRLLIVGGGQDGQLAALSSTEVFTECKVLSRNPSRFIKALASRKSTITVDSMVSDYLSRPEELRRVFLNFRPTAIFYSASHHGPSDSMNDSWDQRKLYKETSIVGLERILDLMSSDSENPGLYFGLSSRMFSPNAEAGVISEHSAANPFDLYGEFKALAWERIRLARKSGIRAGGLIFFNHDSFLKGSGYLGSDIAAQISSHLVSRKRLESLTLRHPQAVVDISNAWDFVTQAIRLMNLGVFDDFVMASGKPISAARLALDVAHSLRKYGLNVALDESFQGDHLATKLTLVGDNRKVQQTLGHGNFSSATEAIGYAALRASGISSSELAFIRDNPNSISSEVLHI